MVPDQTTSGRPRRWSGALVASVIVALAAVVAAAATYLAWRDDRDATEAGAPAGAVPGDSLSGPGTALPDGLTVAPGSSLIGPAVVRAVDSSGEPTSWFAVLLVEGDPITVWTAYVEQIAVLFPDEAIDPSEVPGCLTRNTDEDEVCRLGADADDGRGGRRTAHASMNRVPGDVTGSFLLDIGVSSDEALPVDVDLYHGGGDPWPGGDLPPPHRARPRPAVGEPLAPRTVAYDGDDRRYVLLEGSELIAQYGAGSVTGGFSVMLRTTPGADTDEVAGAYAEQAVQFEGEPVPPPEVVEHEGTTVSVYRPPGGAGGYTGVVTAVDRPDGDDYIVYELFND